MTKLKKSFFLFNFHKIFFSKIKKKLYPVSCLKIIADYSQKVLKQLLKN